MVPQSVKLTFAPAVKKFELRIGSIVLMRSRNAVALHRLADRIRYAAATEARKDYTLVRPWAADDSAWDLTESEIEAGREEYQQFLREEAAHDHEYAALDEALAILRQLGTAQAQHEQMVREVAK
jgi:hypothetical protein